MLGAGQQADEDAAVQPPRRVAGTQHLERPRLRAAVHGFGEVRPRLRVCARRAHRGWRREELEHPQVVVAVGETVVPGVAAEEDALPRLRAHDLSRLRVGEHERALEDVHELVGREDRAEAVGVAEGLPRRQAEHDRVDPVGRHVDPVLDEACVLVSPCVTDGVLRADRRRPIEGGPRRRLIAHDERGGRVRNAPPRPRHASRRTRAPESRSRSFERRRHGPRPALRA